MHIEEGVHIILDLETMGTGPNAAIVSIGAVETDLKEMRVGRTFYQAVDLSSSIGSGGVVDGDTVTWWLKQSDDARFAIRDDTYDIEKALDAFNLFVRGALERSRSDIPSAFVWGNGAAFDNVILRSTYKRLNAAAPWPFQNDRCFRTLLSLASPELREEWSVRPVAHHALEDAAAQADMLFKIFKQGGVHGTN